MPNVHVVDGTFELFRAFYAPRSKKEGPDGREIGATRQLVRSLIGLLKSPEVSHVAVAFDHVIESFRNDLFDGYKTGEGIDPLLHAQFGLAEEAVAALGVVAWPMVEFEADDALATAGVKYGALDEVEEVVICSPDKDLAQSVGGNVVQLDRMRKKRYDAEAVRAKFGVAPESIPDYLALVGDSADGIPGLPRWGAKTSATVLAHYVHLEDIPDDDADWAVTVRGSGTLAKILAENRELVELYRTLAILRTDVPLEESLADLEWKGADKAAFIRLANEVFGSPKLVDTVPAWR